MSKWFEEQLEVNKGRILKLEYKELLESFRSPFQKIDIYDTVSFGKMLVHDDVIMVTEFDETHYHEMIVHPAMCVHPNPERVLIIGGGDGGTLREVIKHPEVRNAHICEIDGDVIRLCKKHFPKLAYSFDDKRVETFVEDGAEFIKKHKNFYNVIIVDSSDPVGPAEVLFREQFFQSMSDALTDDGIVITQSESYLYHRDVIKNIVTFNRRIFPKYSYYYTMVPTYPSGVIGFSFCSKKYDPIADFKPARVDAINELQYYSKDIHKAAFIMPNSFSRFLASI